MAIVGVKRHREPDAPDLHERLADRAEVVAVHADDVHLAERPPAGATAVRMAAASGGSSALHTVHHSPKNSRTAGVPPPPPSAGTCTFPVPFETGAPRTTAPGHPHAEVPSSFWCRST